MSFRAGLNKGRGLTAWQGKDAVCGRSLASVRAILSGLCRCFLSIAISLGTRPEGPKISTPKRDLQPQPARIRKKLITIFTSVDSNLPGIPRSTWLPMRTRNILILFCPSKGRWGGGGRACSVGISNVNARLFKLAFPLPAYGLAGAVPRVASSNCEFPVHHLRGVFLMCAFFFVLQLKALTICGHCWHC